MITMIERRTNTMKKTRTQRENRTHKLNTTDDEGQVKTIKTGRTHQYTHTHTHTHTLTHTRPKHHPRLLAWALRRQKLTQNQGSAFWENKRRQTLSLSLSLAFALSRSLLQSHSRPDQTVCQSEASALLFTMAQRRWITHTHTHTQYKLKVN